MGWKRHRKFSPESNMPTSHLCSLRNNIYTISVNNTRQSEYPLESDANEQNINGTFPIKRPRNEDTRKIKHLSVVQRQVNVTHKYLVLFSAFLVIFICAGFAFHMSVLNNEWMAFFNKTKAETALVQSICVGVLNIAGFPSGLAVAKIGPKKTGIVGGLFVAIGLILSFLATSIGSLIATIGVLSGLGFSLCMNSAFTSISQHFNGRQAMLALSFVSFGSGIGAMCYPLLMQYCINTFGWQGTILIIGGLSLNIPVCSILYNNGPTHNPSNTNNDLIPQESVVKIVKDLLSNKLFVFFVFGLALVTSPLNTIAIFLVDYLESKGMTRAEAVETYFIMTVATTIFRLLPGILKQIPRISVLVFPIVFSSVACIALVLMPGIKENILLKVLVGFYGSSLGGIITVNAIIILKLTGYENFSTAIGMNGAVTGLASLAAGPISGYFRDVTGDYNLSLYTSGAAFGVGSIIFTGLSICRFRTKDIPIKNKTELPTSNDFKINV